MGIICTICGKKQSGWIEDFPLNDELKNLRICANCNEALEKIRTPSSCEIATVKLLEVYLKNVQSSEVREYLNSVLCIAKDPIEARRKAEERIAIQKQQEEEKEKLFEKSVRELLLTTGNGFEGYKVENYIDVISEEIIFKNSFWKQLSAGFEDLGNSLSFKERELSGASELIANARTYVMRKFREKAVAMNANAVLGVNLENSFGSDIVRVSVFGTAVQIKKAEN